MPAQWIWLNVVIYELDRELFSTSALSSLNCGRAVSFGARECMQSDIPPIGRLSPLWHPPAGATNTIDWIYRHGD